MKIIRIYSKAIHKDGIFVRSENNKVLLLSGSLLAELKGKLINIEPSGVEINDNPLALSTEEINEAVVINKYNYNEYKFESEDIKAVCMVNKIK